LPAKPGVIKRQELEFPPQSTLSFFPELELETGGRYDDKGFIKKTSNKSISHVLPAAPL
jgi:hypothetical protein